MWNEEQIKGYIREVLPSRRLEHVIGVEKTAVKMAKHYGCDEHKARVAALIHDCAKYMGDEEIISLMKQNGYILDEVESKAPQLLHGKAASIIAKDKMEIKDEDILNAVIYHTTGRINMSLLEKIIYIADYIEPKRDFPGVEKLREIAFIDINAAMLMSLNNTIKYVIDKKELLHTKTVEARNFLLMEGNDVKKTKQI